MLRPFGSSQDRPIDYAQDRPFDFAQDRQAQHDWKIFSVFKASAVRLEPFDFAQDGRVEG